MSEEIPLSKTYGELMPKIPAAHREGLRDLERKRTQVASQILVASTTEQFINAKTETVDIDVELSRRMARGLEKAFEDGAIDREAFKTAISKLRDTRTSKEREMLVLKRQKKTLTDDVEEELSKVSTLNAAYTSVLSLKIMVTSAKKIEDKFDQLKFKQNVCDRYGTLRVTKSNSKEVFCNVTGLWFPSKETKAAHIVLKSLESDELAYLFGVDEDIVSSPANALTLCNAAKRGLDSGWMVLVPVKDREDDRNRVEWECVITNKIRLNDMVTPGTHWKDLDGKRLIWLNENRPVKRYLYFRFVMTYLHCRKEKILDWTSEVSVKGTMWATPGLYLRKSMLKHLAHEISDQWLPETFYRDTTFEEADGCPTRPADEEKILALSLKHKEEDELVALKEENEEDQSEDEDEEE